MKKKTISKGRREFYLFIERVMAVVFTVSVVVVLCNSYVTIQTTYGDYDYLITPFDKKVVYEDSEVFQDILENSIQDITRMSVIKSQLETNGTYDSQKLIDITDYANRTSVVTNEDVSAVYKLDDLVKWGNYGFDYETIYGTWAELNDYFSKNNTTNGSTESSEITTQKAVGTNTTNTGSTVADQTDGLVLVPSENGNEFSVAQEQTDSTQEEIDQALNLGLEFAEGDQYAMQILVPRYTSSEGKDLIDYASNVYEYEQLKNNLQVTAESLFQNFSEYTYFDEMYGQGKTNLVYCFQMVIDGETKYFTNLKIDLSNDTADQITKEFASYGRYLYFNPDKMLLKTNSSISADFMRSALSEYEYAFEDNTKVWIAVDTTYPVQDNFRAGRSTFITFMPYYWQIIGVALAAFLIGLLYFIKLTVYEGKKVKFSEGTDYEDAKDSVIAEGMIGLQTELDNALLDGEKRRKTGRDKEVKEAIVYEIELKKSDKMPLEIYLMLAAVSIAGIITIAIAVIDYAIHSDMRYEWTPLFCGIIAFFTDVVLMFFYLGIVRRIRAGQLFKNTLVVKFFSGCGKFIYEAYDNGRLVSRTWIPYLVFLAVNLILVLLGNGGIVIAFFFDMFAGIFIYRENKARQEIVGGIENIKNGDLNYQVNTDKLHGDNLVLANSVNSIGEGIRKAVETSMKDERMKADLITNVSHDIKTPLTSIINFVSLLKRENIQDPKIMGYIEVLDSKSQRLKQLTDDLVEASKISSGNITIQFETINFVELIHQTIGEFSEKFDSKNLKIVTRMPDIPLYIEADSRRIWRVIENLFNNIYKYALEGTRVYIEMMESPKDKKCIFSVKNISAQPLNINADELTERFIRGDVSRGTEGSGLGLSIAKNLTEVQKGRFEIYLDGDLFKIILTFPILEIKEIKE